MAPKFSLQPVLDYRHSRVEALEIELSQLIAEQQRVYTFLENLRAYQSHLFDELHRQQDGELNLLTITNVRANLRTIEDRIRHQHMELAALDQQMNAKRAEVITAKQDEEALAVLKTKENERYQAELTRQENRQQDDVYIAQAFRRSTGS